MTSAPPPAAPPPLPPPMEPPSWPPPPPEAMQPVRPQLRRSRTDKILGGVNGGLAEYSGIDALLWRVGFVALTLAAGTGVIVYLLLWVLMPAGPHGVPGTSGVPGTAVASAPAGPRSPVPRITVAALLIVVGVLAMITHFGDWDLAPRGLLGAALLVVGLGLVAAGFTGARTGRGGLIALGVVLSIALIAVSSVNTRAGSGVGDRIYRPVTVAQVQDVYSGGVGDLTIDLSRIPLTDLDGPITTRVEHGVGDVEIVLPRDADVRLSVDHGLGDVDLLGQGPLDSGYFPGHGSGTWVDDDDPEFDVVINSGVGDVEVSRG